MDAPAEKRSDPVSDRLIEENKRMEVKDTRCGIGIIHPGFIQPCANICCFTGYYSLAALLTSTLSSYVNSQVTTLERQFGFSSKQTGIIMAANDIGYLACVLFVSYSASKLHIPRSLGVATVIFGLSGIACSLPHFIFGAQVSPDLMNGDGNQTSFRPAMFGMLCNGLNDTRSCRSGRDSTTDARKSQVSEHVATSSLVIIIIGMVLQGFGKAPRSTFTITYVDNNTKKSNTGFFMGIIITFGILGPAVAYLLGGVFSSLYVTLEPTHLTPRHPKWIGAWWLGYLVFGLLALLVSVALFCFPRRMPSKRPKDLVETVTEKNERYEVSINQSNSKVDDRSVHQVPNVQAKTRSYDRGIYSQGRIRLSRLIRLLKEFLRTLLKLWINPVYLCMAASSVFLVFAISGASAYTPKYMETMFNLQTSKANYIIAGQALFSSCVGTFIGGYLSKRLRMTAMKALKFVLVVVSVALTFTITGFFFQCDQPEVHNWPGSDQPCSGQCNCQDNSYFAICGEDGKTYYSPCSAGCSEIENGVGGNSETHIILVIRSSFTYWPSAGVSKHFCLRAALTAEQQFGDRLLTPN